MLNETLSTAIESLKQLRSELRHAARIDLVEVVSQIIQSLTVEKHSSSQQSLDNYTPRDTDPKDFSRWFTDGGR